MSQDKLDVNELKAMLEKEQAEKIDACVKEVQVVLEKFNCRIVPQITLSPKGIEAGISFEAA